MSTSSQNSSLYVGDLHQDVTEALLYEVFREIGAILSIKVCRDSMTSKSLGYAYVNFQNPQDAARAIDLLNFQEVKGKPIRIMYVQRDPTTRKTGLGNIFIKNLDSSIDNKLLYDTFSNIGNITSCKVCTRKVEKLENGKVVIEEEPLGYGFVHFDNPDSAKLAVQKVNGMAIAGKIVSVAPFVRKLEREKLSSGSSFTNIYIKDLDTSIDEKSLKEAFKTFGDITSIYLSTKDGKPTGFAFLNFKDHDSAVKAIKEMNDKEIEGLSVKGKNLYVSKAEKKEVRRQKLREDYEKRKQETQGLNVYVKNLEENIDEEKLKKMFEKFGKITSAIVMKDDETKASRGFGFVCFENQDSAGKAISEMHQKMIGNKPLYVSLAQRKDLRKQELEIQHQQRQNLQRNLYPQLFIQQGQRQQGYPYQKQQQPQQQRWTSGKQTQPKEKKDFKKKDKEGKERKGKGGEEKKQQGTDIKYNTNVRNVTNKTQTKPKQTQPIQNTDSFNATTLANLSPRSQKQTLGEHLYPLVYTVQPVLASKITGMLLEMENGDILHLLESPDALNAKIQEALNVLSIHENQEKK